MIKIPNKDSWTKPLPTLYAFKWEDQIMCIEDIMLYDKIIFKKNNLYTVNDEFKQYYYETLGNFPIVPGRQHLINLNHFFIPLKEIRKQKLNKLSNIS